MPAKNRNGKEISFANTRRVCSTTGIPLSSLQMSSNCALAVVFSIYTDSVICRRCRIRDGQDNLSCDNKSTIKLANNFI
jgi:hypothetical protein